MDIPKELVQTGLFELIIAQIAVMYLIAGGNERVVEFISKQVELRLKYRLSSGAIQMIAFISGIVICMLLGVKLIPNPVGQHINIYVNMALAGAVVGLSSSFLHDTMGLLNQLKDYFKTANVYTNAHISNKRTGKF